MFLRPGVDKLPADIHRGVVLLKVIPRVAVASEGAISVLTGRVEALISRCFGENSGVQSGPPSHLIPEGVVKVASVQEGGPAVPSRLCL